MAILDKIKVGGADYEIVDSQARADIETLKESQGGSTSKTYTIEGNGYYFHKDETLDIPSTALTFSLEDLKVGDVIELVHKEAYLKFPYIFVVIGDEKGGLGRIGTFYCIDNNGNVRGIKYKDVEEDSDYVTFYVIGDSGSVDLTAYYTKVETDSLVNAKQNKLDGDYVKDVEVGGSYINFNSMKFDGNNNGSTSVNFKTVNGQPIFGTGDIEVSVDTSDLATKAEVSAKADASDLGGLKLVKLTQSEYNGLNNKDSNTLYVIYG